MFIFCSRLTQVNQQCQICIYTNYSPLAGRHLVVQSLVTHVNAVADLRVALGPLLVEFLSFSGNFR